MAAKKKKEAAAPAVLDEDKPIIVEAMGITVTLHKDTFNDWHLIETLADIEETESPRLIVRFMRMVLGEQYERVMSSLELEDGSLPSERVMEFMQALIEAVNPN